MISPSVFFWLNVCLLACLSCVDGGKGLATGIFTLKPPGICSTRQGGGNRREGIVRALASVSLSVMGVGQNTRSIVANPTARLGEVADNTPSSR
jgi:hypothetical protein